METDPIKIVNPTDTRIVEAASADAPVLPNGVDSPVASSETSTVTNEPESVEASQVQVSENSENISTETVDSPEDAEKEKVFESDVIGRAKADLESGVITQEAFDKLQSFMTSRLESKTNDKAETERIEKAIVSKRKEIAYGLLTDLLSLERPLPGDTQLSTVNLERTPLEDPSSDASEKAKKVKIGCEAVLTELAKLVGLDKVEQLASSGMGTGDISRLIAEFPKRDGNGDYIDVKYTSLTSLNARITLDGIDFGLRYCPPYRESDGVKNSSMTFSRA